MSEPIEKHTPGRWLESNRTYRTHNDPERFWARYVHTADELKLVATAYGATQEEAEANAAFIASACNSRDELLEALKTIVSYNDASSDPDFGLLALHYDKAVKAIAKAEGR